MESDGAGISTAHCIVYRHYLSPYKLICLLFMKYKVFFVEGLVAPLTPTTFFLVNANPRFLCRKISKPNINMIFPCFDCLETCPTE
jgi:hypothetical protein